MIDFQTATTYLQQCIDSLKLEKVELDAEVKAIEGKKKQLLLDKETLIAQKSAFLAQTQAQTKENERCQKLYHLAVKMKAQTDDDLKELTQKASALAMREEKVSQLEEQKKELDELEKQLKKQKEEYDEKDLLLLKREKKVELDKDAARQKQEDLDILKVAITKKQERVQKILDAQHI